MFARSTCVSCRHGITLRRQPIIGRIARTYIPALTFTFSQHQSSSTLPKPPSQYTRTHTCGDLSIKNLGERVVLCGWIEPPRKLSSGFAFIPLRDGYGTTQIVVRGKKGELSKVVDELSSETVVCAVGTVVRRPNMNIRKDLPTGEVEVKLDELHVLNKADPLPYREFKGSIPNEEFRLQYRYLELRGQNLQRNIRFRSKATNLIRNYLSEHNFIEIETPLLFKSTPEGAREFLVPSRNKGHFYALPQSPQQYKQLLMAGAMDRYFQIARCFRDEDLRADRQPEFTQVDIEMSFPSVTQIRSLLEDLLKKLYKDILNREIGYEHGFPVMSYQEAMSRYGSDKPDLRYGLEIYDLSSLVPGLMDSKSLEVLVIPQGLKFFTGNEIKNLEAFANEEAKNKNSNISSSAEPHKIVILRAAGSNRGQWVASIPLIRRTDAVGDNGSSGLTKWFERIHKGDLVFIAQRPRELQGGSTLLGTIRTHIASRLHSKGHLQYSPGPKFLWVDTFPLFTPSSEESMPSYVIGDFNNSSTDPSTDQIIWTSTHHPFTAPVPEDYELLNSNPGKVRAQHYDLVLNGCEIAGGSIRIHDPALQKFVFDKILKLSLPQTKRFQHLIDALRFGCPPHGGIAIGFDRLLSIMLNTQSIRDVIAFPKGANGVELMVGSPSIVSDDQLREYGIRVDN